MGMKGPNFMSEAARLSKTAVLLFALIVSALPSGICAEAVEFKEHKTSLSTDVFNQNFYYAGTEYLRLDRLYRAVFRKKERSRNVNVYDEIADSSFFTNRHSRNRMSSEELAKGFDDGGGPDLSQPLTISRGKFEGLNPGFFVKDHEGREYLFKFDPADNLELSTAAEVIVSRFFYAIGYNVPQNTLVYFDASQLVPGESAKIIDSTGFKRKLTAEKLEEYLLFIPWTEDGKFRASASKILSGEMKGGFSYQGRRKEDPQDLIDHEDRRELRALQVFGSWLGNFDIRQENTMDVVVEENGKKQLKHYLIDMNGSLGASANSPKPPMFMYEYMFDFAETTKAILSLGLWEKPWQKRWKEAGEESHSPATGYFDSNRFDPEKYKKQLPHYALKDVTRADGFWAAKIIHSFSDEDILAIVKTGGYSDPQDTEYVAKVLSERRDIVTRYWFTQANPLDNFDYRANELTFDDLAVKAGFEASDKTIYHVDVISKNGKRGKKITSLQFHEASIPVEAGWFEQGQVDLLIRTSRNGAEPGAYVLVELTSEGLTGIIHQD
jgi:hypothetical protein